MSNPRLTAVLRSFLYYTCLLSSDISHVIDGSRHLRLSLHHILPASVGVRGHRFFRWLASGGDKVGVSLFVHDVAGL